MELWIAILIFAIIGIACSGKDDDNYPIDF